MTRRYERVRTLAAKVPGLRHYENRVSELTAEVERLAAANSAAPLFVAPGHFYSPIPPVAEIDARAGQIFGRDPQVIPGVELGLDAQRQLLDELEPGLVDMPFADGPVSGLRYQFENFAYGHGDGTFLHLMLRHLRPRRLIELGSGFSSACTLDTVENFLDWQTELTFVDPYPELFESLLRPGDTEHFTQLAVGTQDVDLELIRTLAAGDVLFVDSTHVVRTGSDVCRLFFEILPALAPGVYIHLHDIFPAFEYPDVWVREGRAWTEVYLLRAFLQYNDAFEVALWPGLLYTVDHVDVVRRFPTMLRNPGGAIWLRKTR